MRTFNWEAGTQDSPVVLTSRQLQALVSVAGDEAVESDVKGWITLQGSVPQIGAGNYYVLNRKYNGNAGGNTAHWGDDYEGQRQLHIVAQTVADTYSVYLDGGNTIDEGSSAYFVSNGIDMGMLEMEIIGRSFSLEDGTMTEALAAERIALTREDGKRWKLTCAAAGENDTWQMTLTVKVWPSYNATTVKTVTVVVSARGFTTVVINGAGDITEGESTTYTAETLTRSGKAATKAVSEVVWSCDSGANIGTRTGVYTAPDTGASSDVIRATFSMYGSDLQATKTVTIWTTVLNNVTAEDAAADGTLRSLNPRLFALMVQYSGVEPAATGRLKADGTEVLAYSNRALQGAENVQTIFVEAIKLGTQADRMDLTEIQYCTKCTSLSLFGVGAMNRHYYVDNIIVPKSVTSFSVANENSYGTGTVHVGGRLDMSQCKVNMGLYGGWNSIIVLHMEEGSVWDMSGVKGFDGDDNQTMKGEIKVEGAVILPTIKVTVPSCYNLQLLSTSILEGGTTETDCNLRGWYTTAARKVKITSATQRVYLNMGDLDTLVDAEGNEYRTGRETGFEAFDFLNGGKVGFYGCQSLRLERIGYPYRSIAAYAFQGCVSLALESLPETLTSIGAYAFQGCVSLALESLPETLTSIGAYAFQGCVSLALEETEIENRTWTSFFANAWPADVLEWNKMVVNVKAGATVTQDNFGLLVLPTQDRQPILVEVKGRTILESVQFKNNQGNAPYCIDLYGFVGFQTWRDTVNNQASIFVLPAVNYVVNCSFANMGGTNQGMTRSTLYVPDALVASYRAATNWMRAKAIRAHSEYLATDKALILAGQAPEYDTDYTA